MPQKEEAEKTNEPLASPMLKDVLSALTEAAKRNGGPLALVFDSRGRQFDFVSHACHTQGAYKAFTFENFDNIIADIEEIGR